MSAFFSQRHWSRISPIIQYFHHPSMLMVPLDLENGIDLLFFDPSVWLMVKGPSAENAFNQAFFFVCGWVKVYLRSIAKCLSQVSFSFFLLKLLEGDIRRSTSGSYKSKKMESSSL